MKQINRKGSYSVKTDALEKYYGRDDLLPLWIADMDFETPLCIREALQDVIDKGVYGYNHIPDNYFPVIIEWLENQQGWSVKQEWLSFIPGLVKGIGYAVNYFTKPGDGIIVQPPVYPPFINLPEGNNRRVVFNPLIRDGEYYRMDMENLETILSGGGCKMLILCNPHNPGGIAWDVETLAGLAGICRRHGIIVISDEIHADMPLSGNRHIPFASVSEDAAQISITFGSPSKTFNMAGIVSSYSVIPNASLRESFYNWMQVNEFNNPTIFATLGAIAAYTKGLPWRGEMLKYIEGNIEFIGKYLGDNYNTMRIKPLSPQSSFLVWLDCRELCKKLFKSETDADAHKKLVELFVDGAGLALNDGTAFGPGGEGYMRLNAGCGRLLIEQALEKLRNAILKYIN